VLELRDLPLWWGFRLVGQADSNVDQTSRDLSCRPFAGRIPPPDSRLQFPEMDNPSGLICVANHVRPRTRPETGLRGYSCHSKVFDTTEEKGLLGWFGARSSLSDTTLVKLLDFHNT
jgi:hypothetical protein